ncbi:MAG: chitobiase/beta-hexosaminidase C-terminal domain-containing protein [Candidatus Micrarchaeota archaeon]|nr:chitobiase/beta-hexosaminidase C-terminal domain-containing protein [Candidatus Micrarchaeota archaeon]
MKTSSRAQGATEYLVGIAVVVFVALVAITLLNNAPSTASDAKVTQSKAYWGAVGPLSIVEASAVPRDSGASTPYLKVRNNEAYPLKITALLGNNQTISTLQNGTVPSCYNIGTGGDTMIGASDSCSFSIVSGASSGTTLGGAVSLCTDTGTPGYLVIDNFGFEYQTQAGITKKQYGKPLIIPCSAALPKVCADLTVSPVAGSYTTAQNVSLSTSTSGSTIYYTTDGSTPTMSSSTYSSPINIPLDTNMTIKAFAAKANYSNSSALTASYIVTHSITKMVSGAISGINGYSSPSFTALANVTIYLKQGGATMYSFRTNSSGAYSFPAVAPGTYNVYFSLSPYPYSHSPVSGTDVAQTGSFSNASIQIIGIRVLAMDVYQNSPSTNITIEDANDMGSFFLTSGVWQDPPPPGSYVFTPSQYATAMTYNNPMPPIPYAGVSDTPGYSGITITVGGSDMTQDFTAAVYGDANLGYNFWNT